jgi:PIN domain nuclease of toxin-antitoxin system
MKLLLDTHAYIWWGIDPAKLSPKAAEALSQPESEIYVSVASDHMLIAQSLAEGFVLVTRDPRIRDYGVPILW